MESRRGTFGAARVRTAAIIALTSFAAMLALPSRFKIAALVVMVAAALGVLVLSLAWMQGRSGSRAVGGVAAGSAVGLAGSVMYLRSLADEPAAIPVGGFAVLMLSLIGLLVSAVLLRDRSRLVR